MKIDSSAAEAAAAMQRPGQVYIFSTLHLYASSVIATLRRTRHTRAGVDVGVCLGQEKHSTAPFVHLHEQFRFKAVSPNNSVPAIACVHG